MAPGIPPATVRNLLLQLPKRRRLYEAIVARPGLHARRLSRQLPMALGVVEHHLRQLQKHGLVFDCQGGRRRTYYAAGQVTGDEARLIHALRKDAWGAIMAALATQGPCAVGGLATWLDMPASTVGYHLRRMKEAKLLDHVRLGRDSFYVLIDADAVEHLMQRLHPESKSGMPDETFQGLVSRAHHIRASPPGAPPMETTIEPLIPKV